MEHTLSEAHNLMAPGNFNTTKREVISPPEECLHTLQIAMLRIFLLCFPVPLFLSANFYVIFKNDAQSYYYNKYCVTAEYFT